MEFRIKTEYTKNLLGNIFLEERKGAVRFSRTAAIIITILSILSLSLSFSSSDSHKSDIINLILTILAWLLYFNIKPIIVSIQMLVIRKRKLDGKRILIINEQEFYAKNLKHNREVSFPTSEIKEIKDIGSYYKIKVGGKWMYIESDGFELGNAEAFYNWIKVMNKTDH